MSDEPEVIVDPEPAPEPEPTPEPEVVSKEIHNQVRTDMHKYKTAMKTQESKIADLEQKLESVATQKLESKEEYKKLYETAKEDLAKVKDEKSNLVKSIFLNEKLDKIEFAARKAGMNEDQISDLSRYPEYIDMVETDTTERGRIQVEGVETMLEKVKSDRPGWFNKGKAPNLNTRTSDGAFISDQKPTPAAMLKLEREDKPKYNALMKKHWGIG